MSKSIIYARLSMLPFAALIWFIMWSVGRFVPTPIKDPTKRMAMIILFGAFMFAHVSGQMFLYRWLSGIRALKNDSFFSVAFPSEYAIGFGIFLYGAFKRQRIDKS